MFRAIFAAVVLACGSVFAAEEFDASVDRNAPDFIRASILYCGPVDTLYGCVGHIAIRLTCPHYQLDEVFSYEGEPVKHQVWRFLSGQLKMGMFATPTAEFLKEYADEGRGAWEYPLNLSPAAKVRLWKILDDKVAEGPNLPYDYIRRGCAQSALKTLLTAIAPEPIVSEKAAQFGLTRRDIMHDTLVDFPWTRLFIHLTTGPASDRMLASTDCVIMPRDFIAYLRGVSVKGCPILVGEPKELQAQKIEVKGGRGLSPFICAVGLSLLAVIGCFWVKRTIFALFAALYVALAVFETYVGVFSTLPAAAWNVLLIPFNPLPILLWKWRKYWAKPFVAVLVGWSAWVVLAEHLPTDPAFAVLAIAYAVVVFGRQFIITKSIRFMV